MHAASSEPAVSEKRDAGFPKAARLLKTDEFSSVFRLRPWSRSAHFVIYGRHTAGPARLGLVVGRKFAPRSVSRNLVRRVAREAFRLRRADLSGWDILIRLHRRLDRQALPSAASPPLARLFADEIGALMTKAVQRAGTPPAAPAGDARPVATGAK